MIRRRSALSVLVTLPVLVLLSAPTGLAAQEDDQIRTFTFSSGRPRIGVTVDSRADKERDRLGARLQAVTPDGPAAKAGLEAGDIITRFNGVSLGGLKGDDEDESGPAQKLVELAQKLEPGDTAEVEYRRGGDTKKAKIVARELTGMGMGHGFRRGLPRMGLEGEFPPGMPLLPDDGGGDFRLFIDGEGRGLHLADLNPELGEYFGAKQGVLVLETPKDSTLPLKAGDVILTIDGRTPTSEGHARRILRSYDAGETAKLEILRKQKKLTLSWKVPEREWKWQAPGSREKVKIERS
jgi:S1-C subfamily serine protease